MKKIIAGVVLGVVCMVGMAGGISVASASDAEIAQLQSKVSLLQSLVSHVTQLQFVQFQMPEPAHDDEGQITVVVNNAMRFACEGKSDTDGQYCVRHEGSTGVSYVDLETIKGFTHDAANAYDLQLLKLRSDEYGQDDLQQFNYTLVRINRLTAL